MDVCNLYKICERCFPRNAQRRFDRPMTGLVHPILLSVRATSNVFPCVDDALKRRNKPGVFNVHRTTVGVHEGSNGLSKLMMRAAESGRLRNVHFGNVFSGLTNLTSSPQRKNVEDFIRENGTAECLESCNRQWLRG